MEIRESNLSLSQKSFGLSLKSDVAFSDSMVAETFLCDLSVFALLCNEVTLIEGVT